MPKFLDITREDNDRLLLSLRDRQLRTLFETTLDAIAIADDQGHYLDVNPAACELFGLAREELLGRSILEFAAPGFDFQAEWQEFQQQEKVRGEFQLVCADGELRVVEYAAVANFLPHRHLSVLRDITDRKQAEAKVKELTVELDQLRPKPLSELEQAQAQLRESQQRLENILNSIEGVVWSIHPETFQIIYINPAVEQIFGYSVADFWENPNLWQEIVHPEDQDIITAAFPKLFEHGKTRTKHRIIRADRQVRWMLVNSSLIYDEIGKPIRIDGITTDITEQVESKETLEKVAQHVLGAIYQFRQRPDGTIHFPYASAGIEEICGVSPAELREDASRAFILIHPDDLSRVSLSIIESARTLTPWYCEYRSSLADGQVQWLLGHATLQRELDGGTVWHGYIRDITDQKYIETALAESEAQNRAVLQAIPDLMFRINRQGVYLSYIKNPTLLDFRGEEGSSLGKNMVDYLSPEHYQRQKDYMEIALATRQTQVYEQEVTIDGRVQQEEVRVVTIEGLEEVLFIIRDISEQKTALRERKLAEAALAESEAQNRAILQAIPDIMFRVNKAGIYLEYATSTKFLDLSSTQSIGKSMADELSPEHYQRHMHNLAIALETGQIQTYEQEVTIAGQIQHEEVRVVPLDDREEVVFIIRDIGDRKRAETALAASEAQNRAILQAIPDIIFRVNREGVCLSYFNPILPSDILGGKNPTSQNMADYLPPELYQRNIRKLVIALETKQAQIYEQEVTIVGCIQQEEVRVVPIEDKEEVLFIVRDISDRKRAEAGLKQQSAELERTLKKLQNTQAQLIQSEKMSSLGQLVAGIAHEINNPVSFIHGNIKPAHDYASSLIELIHLYQAHYPSPPPIISDFAESIDLDYLANDFPKLLESMKVGAARITDIVKSLRTFSRLDEAGLKAIDLHENIDSTLAVLQSRLNGLGGNPEILVTKNYDDLPFVEAYGGLLNQVFMNLLVNAIDAIEQQQVILNLTRKSRYNPESDSEYNNAEYNRVITITTAVNSAKEVTISIKDNGSGMSPQIQEKIFNPFFTTKPVGKGTGMGLAISYQIIQEKHQGNISVNSTLGKGTEFVITLPIKQVSVA
jgi:PAS domain S-box-containing protein